MARACFIRLGAAPLFAAANSSTFGGAEVRAFTFARGLAKYAEHVVSFAVRSNNLQLPATYENVQIRPMPERSRGVAKIMNSLRRRFVERPAAWPGMQHIDADVVACFGVHDPTANVVAACQSTRQRTCLFLTSSEDVDEINTLNQNNNKRRRYQQQRDFTLRNVDAIVAQTEFQQATLRARFDRESYLIRNPIDTFVDTTALTKRRAHVLWVGRADSDSKRADICFALARRCPDVPFCVVMNDCDSPLGRRLLVNKPANVTVHQHVPFSQIEQLYADASVLINTSVSEGFPNAFLQAAKFATPIISLNVDPDGMLEHHGCGRVAGDEQTMARLIREFHHATSQPDAQRTSFGTAARRYVVEHHEQQARIAELDTLIHELLKTQRDSRAA